MLDHWTLIGHADQYFHDVLVDLGCICTPIIRLGMAENGTDALVILFKESAAGLELEQGHCPEGHY